MLKQGLIQIYTGDGKGKTTAALGLALRASGQGNKVLFFQFLKPSSLELGERKAIAAANLNIQIDSIDMPWNMATAFDEKLTVEQMRKTIKDAIERLTKIVKENSCDLLILDEIVFCLSMNLVKLEDIKHLLQIRPDNLEIVLTGRGATKELIELADLVTEMKNIKHPYQNGINAREGIDF